MNKIELSEQDLKALGMTENARADKGGEQGGPSRDRGPVTLDEHRDYLRQITRLQLWFLWHWLREHPDEAFASAMRNRIDIFRKTDINQDGLNPAKPAFDDPRWIALENRAAAIHERTHRDATADRFEIEAFEVFRDSLEARAPRDFGENPVAHYRCGSLTYGKPAAERPELVPFHIANAVSPRSIFDDPAYLPSCFRDLMDKSEAEYGATWLGTFTWLNSHPRWLALFPAEWTENLQPENRDVLWHYGYWGQFLNARRTFNAKLGAQMRRTGALPYWPRYSECSFAAMRRQLAAKV